MAPRLGYAWFLLLAGFFLYSAEWAWGEELVRLKEDLPPGYQYHVSGRTELSGQMTLSPQKDQKEPKLLPLTGESALEYDERILKADKEGQVDKTLRVYRGLALHRKVGDQPQEASLRPEVRRLVVLRHKGVEVPFSPDGPLTPPEIDLIRTDIFTPAFSGLLPDKAVKAGDR